MKPKTWLLISYWIGIILDFIIAGLALIPAAMGLPSYAHPMGLFSAAVFSWAILLSLAARNPLERRWVLLPTIIIGTGLLLANVFSAAKGLRPASMVIPYIVVGLAVISFWTYSYILSGKAEQ